MPSNLFSLFAHPAIASVSRWRQVSLKQSLVSRNCSAAVPSLCLLSSTASFWQSVGHFQSSPNKQTFSGIASMSQKCQQRKFPVIPARVGTWLRHRRDVRLASAAPRAGSSVPACNAARLSTMA